MRNSAFAVGVPLVTSLEKVDEGCHWSGSAPDLTKALRMPAEVLRDPVMCDHQPVEPSVSAGSDKSLSIMTELLTQPVVLALGHCWLLGTACVSRAVCQVL